MHSVLCVFHPLLGSFSQLFTYVHLTAKRDRVNDLLGCSLTSFDVYLLMCWLLLARVSVGLIVYLLVHAFISVRSFVWLRSFVCLFVCLFVRLLACLFVSLLACSLVCLIVFLCHVFVYF